MLSNILVGRDMLKTKRVRCLTIPFKATTNLFFNWNCLGQRICIKLQV